MLRARGDQVNAGGLDGAVTQHVSQLDHIPAHLIKGPGKQVPQVMGEHLAGGHPGRLAEPFHLRPDLPSGQTFSASGEKDLAGGGFLLPGVLFQLPAQLAREQDGTQLSFQGDLGSPRLGGLHGDILYLAHPDAGGADSLQEESQPLPAQGVGGGEQALILLPGELPAVIPEEPALDP